MPSVNFIEIESEPNRDPTNFRRVFDAVAAGQVPPDAGIAADRFARAAVRVALRQLQAVESSSPALATWLSAHDRLDPDEPNDSIGDHPCTP
jgi:hypothetical protein